MAESNYLIEIPENADKILFAEDLIRYVMLRNVSGLDSAWGAGPYKEFTYNGFNETTEMAVRFLHHRMAMDDCHIFHDLANGNGVDHKMYTMIANDVIATYFPSGFVANRFLPFCVHVASLAAYFYKNGVPEALDLAVMYIVKPIQDIDMTTGGWDTLNSSAQSFATMELDSEHVVFGERGLRPGWRRS